MTATPTPASPATVDSVMALVDALRGRRLAPWLGDDIRAEVTRLAAQSATPPEAWKFDAAGDERTRHVRITHDGSWCICLPQDVADLVGDMDGMQVADVWLSEAEVEALPEFEGF